MRAFAALLAVGLTAALATVVPATPVRAAEPGNGREHGRAEKVPDSAASTRLVGTAGKGAVTEAAEALTVHDLDDVRGNLTLPTTGPDGTTVAWASADPAVVSPTGEVRRPAPGAGTATVALTATVSRDGVSASRNFTAVVPELPAPQEFAGYVFSYFTGEGTADGEQVYFALSRGNDPLRWRELNDGRPVLTSTLGERGLRDPFIIRSPEGDKFYQIATDLRIYGNGNWDRAQRHGSKSIMVWESTDLVNWTDQRLVRVSPDTAGNTWAPEAFYDEGLGAYVVFWASKLYAEDDPEHTGDSYNRMMYATTRDFVTFSEPRVWVDPGYSVIDSTMVAHDGSYYRFTKDERNNTSSTPCSKFIVAEKSETILDPDYDFIAECIGKGAINQGEGPTVFKSNTEEKWYLFIDEFGGRGYVPFETTDLDSGVWTMSTGYDLPASPRHGTVLPVTRAEYDRLLRAYAPEQAVERVDEVALRTGVGDAPILPGTVTAYYADGGNRPAAVTWDAVPPSAYAAPGGYTVRGVLTDEPTVEVRATVTVTAEGVPVRSLSVTPSKLRLGVGVSRQLDATVLPANATARALSWTSSNRAVARVSASGMVTTVAPGTAKITVRTADSSRRVVVPVEVTRAIPTDLLLHYPFDDSAGGTGGTAGMLARDATGRGNDGRYERTPAFGRGVRGGSFRMSGGSSGSSTAPYLTIPPGVLAGVHSVTVSTYVKWDASTTVNQWLFGLGPDNQRYLFASPRNGGGLLYSAITTGSWSAESKLTGGSALPGGVWKHLAVTVDSAARTAALYLDGLPVARASDVTIRPSDLYDPTKGYSGYIGRSLYAPDPYFAGEVDDFRIYGRALSPAEILLLAGNTTAVVGVTLPQLKVPALVDDANSRIVLPVREGTDLRRLAPRFELAPGARISPGSGKRRDFREPVRYTVTGADRAERSWTVQATVMRSPVLPGLNADPHIAVFGDRFYLYPTTDGFPGWSGTQFKAYSSSDLVHWQDHGVILDLGPDVSWADDRAWAPAIAERDGRYYFYFSADANLGVAVADSPTGPFRDPLGRPLVAAGAYSGQAIDPMVFTDDDGQSYLYWGQGAARVVPLNADMVSFDPAQVRTITPSGYNEASFVFKRNGLYYLMWSENDTRDENYRVAYATGPSPYGPWTRHGVVLEKRPAYGIRGPGHHSVVRVPGTDEWYIAYHRFALPGGDGTHRETTIDRMTFDAAGRIAPVTPTLESIDPLPGR